MNFWDPFGTDIREIESNETIDQARAASEAAGAQGDAGDELTRNVSDSLRQVTGHADRQARRRGFGKITTNGGVKRNGILGRLFGGKRFSQIRPETQSPGRCSECAGIQGTPGAGPTGDGAASNIVVQTVSEQGSFTDDPSVGSPGFDNFVNNVTNHNQTIANTTGRVVAVVVSNRRARPTSTRSRRFVITPDE